MRPFIFFFKKYISDGFTVPDGTMVCVCVCCGQEHLSMFQTVTIVRQLASKLWCSPTHWVALLQERCVDEGSHRQGSERTDSH